MNNLLKTMAQKMAHMINVRPKDVDERMYVDYWENQMKTITSKEESEIVSKIGCFITCIKKTVTFIDGSKLEVLSHDDVVIPEVKVK